LHPGQRQTLDANKIVELSLAHPQIYNESKLDQLLRIQDDPFFQQLEQKDNLTRTVSTDAKYMADRITDNNDYHRFGLQIIQYYDAKIRDKHDISFAKSEEKIKEILFNDYCKGNQHLKTFDKEKGPSEIFMDDHRKVVKELLGHRLDSKPLGHRLDSKPLGHRVDSKPLGHRVDSKPLEFARCMIRNPEMATKILDDHKAREVARHFQFVRIACSNPDLVRDILNGLAISGVRQALTEGK
jgi:hypothetical protein